MKEKLKAVFDSKITWGVIGTVAGAFSPALVPVVHAIGDFVMMVL